MSNIAKNLKQFLQDNIDRDLSVEQLVTLFFEEYGVPEMATQAELDREVQAINALINEVNMQSIYKTLGI